MLAVALGIAGFAILAVLFVAAAPVLALASLALAFLMRAGLALACTAAALALLWYLSAVLPG